MVSRGGSRRDVVAGSGVGSSSPEAIRGNPGAGRGSTGAIRGGPGAGRGSPGAIRSGPGASHGSSGATRGVREMSLRPSPSPGRDNRSPSLPMPSRGSSVQPGARGRSPIVSPGVPRPGVGSTRGTPVKNPDSDEESSEEEGKGASGENSQESSGSEESSSEESDANAGNERQVLPPGANLAGRNPQTPLFVNSGSDEQAVKRARGDSSGSNVSNRPLGKMAKLSSPPSSFAQARVPVSAAGRGSGPRSFLGPSTGNVSSSDSPAGVGRGIPIHRGSSTPLRGQESRTLQGKAGSASNPLTVRDDSGSGGGSRAKSDLEKPEDVPEVEWDVFMMWSQEEQDLHVDELSRFQIWRAKTHRGPPPNKDCNVPPPRTRILKSMKDEDRRKNKWAALYQRVVLLENWCKSCWEFNKIGSGNVRSDAQGFRPCRHPVSGWKCSPCQNLKSGCQWGTFTISPFKPKNFEKKF